jgi:exo-beta-1,3-glucanase (GH17 family)/cellulose synthase/poly-beta-1,6-N-acetylglucosamine synthase-like glycosyltransferase
MTRSALLSFTLVACVVASLWALIGGPVAEPAAPAAIGGFSFSPLRRGQDPAKLPLPTAAQLDEDLALVARQTQRIRLYSVDGSFAAVPALAKRHGLEVTAGVWLDAPTGGGAAANAARLRALADVIERNDNVTRAIVGNETLLRGDASFAELASVLDRTRATLRVPVGTAEPWHVWLANPALAEHVDFIAVHLLPYWEGIHVDAAVDHVAARVRDLEARFPDKPIVIGEVGWPSWGRSRGDAAATLRNAATFARRFLAHAEQQGYDYFLLEAFDQPWKRSDEGEVGAYWGVYNVDRRAKFELRGAIQSIPNWQVLAAVSIALAFAALCLLLADSYRLRGRGRVFLALTASLITPATVWGFSVHAQQYWTPLSVLSAFVLFAGMLGVLVLLLVEAHEWAEAQWNRHRAHVDVPPPRMLARLPKVSIHVPAHAEPPEMVVETLQALAALNYPDFEVIVIDNNTADEKLWRPVEACCARLGPRFRFFHVAPLAGYKAGALNFALRRTAEDAAIVAVVDSDYRVDPQWLRALMPRFAPSRVAIVQAPQAYRDGSVSAFKGMCEAEYRGFFEIGMVTRDNRNAIIQHGTMTMIRKDVLLEVGGWAEWTITEDAELGLRVLEHGYDAVYTPECHGWGLTPDTFSDYKGQRFRWALGATQILRRHGRKLLGLAPCKLSLGQRFHFLTGWLNWLGDGVNLLFNAVAIVWSACMIAKPLEFFPPLATFSAFVLALFVFKLVKMIALYRTRVNAGFVETLAAVVAGLALVHVVGRAVLAGAFGRNASFFRTPKLARRQSLAGALAVSLWETALAVLLLAAVVGIAVTAPYASIDRTLWGVLLAAMAAPHVAALAAATLSAVPGATQRVPLPRLREPLPEGRRVSL